MIKFILSLLLCASTVQAAEISYTADDIRVAKWVAKDFDEGNGATQIYTALATVLNLAAREMHKHGAGVEADELRREWSEIYGPMLLSEDLGDHSPTSIWLAQEYDKIEAILGPSLCDFLHLSDIKVINYTIPVVFNPLASETWCVEQLKTHPDDTCEMEYRRHFAGTKWVKGFDAYATARLHHGLVPVVSYWVAWGICEGAGGSMACSPIATAVEFVGERYICPKLSDKIYERKNP